MLPISPFSVIESMGYRSRRHINFDRLEHLAEFKTMKQIASKLLHLHAKYVLIHIYIQHNKIKHA